MQLVSPGPIAFSVGGFDIRWYGVIIAIGVMLAVIIACRRAERRGISVDDMLDIFLIAVPCGIIGLRVYYVAFNWADYAGDFMKMINIREGGLAIHGGLIFGILAAYLVCRHKGISFLSIADVCAPCIALAQSIGRWGNFFNEEAHGCVTDFPIAVLIDGTSYHATFLYESVWCLLLFIVLSIVESHPHFKGKIFCLYVGLYSIERFCVEFLRTDSLMIGPFKQAMVLSAVAFVIALICYIYLKRKDKNENRIFSR